MRQHLLQSIRPEIAGLIRGTTDSEWIYALIVSLLADPRGAYTADELVRAVDRAFAIIRAVRYCFDFGCYRTEDPAKVHEYSMIYAGTRSGRPTIEVRYLD